MSNMQSTVLARDERLDSLAPLEWEIMSMLGCAGWNCGLGIGIKRVNSISALSCGGPWALYHPCGSPTATLAGLGQVTFN